MLTAKAILEPVLKKVDKENKAYAIYIYGHILFAMKEFKKAKEYYLSACQLNVKYKTNEMDKMFLEGYN